MLFTKSGRKAIPATDAQIIEAACEIAARSLRTSGQPLTSPRAASSLLTAMYAGLEHEVFGVLFLDSRHRLIAYEAMFRGTIDGAAVHPREVVKAALKHNAAAVILAHNHPSGVLDPSNADQMITDRLSQALALIDVRVVDHVIVGGPNLVSFAERGLL
jgi:DNA repair protein RadC